MLEIRNYEKSKCVSAKVWDYRFPWPIRERYLEDKALYLALNVENKGLSHSGICEKLALSIKYVFDTCIKVAGEEYKWPISLREAEKDNIKTSLETCYDSEVLKPLFKIEKGREWRIIQLNISFVLDTAEKILIEDCTEEQKEKYVDDWCQYLEGVTVQELAHVLFLEDVVKDEKRKALFVEQMIDYPTTDTPISNTVRGKKYLTKDIERHGMFLELDFLSKMYPGSWAETWRKYDVKESLVTS